MPELKTDSALLPGYTPKVGTMTRSSSSGQLAILVNFLIEEADPSNCLIFLTVSFIFSAGLTAGSYSTSTLLDDCLKLVICGDLCLVSVVLVV